MNYQFWSLALGLTSIFLFQLEQSLRFWLESFQKERPIYLGSWLPKIAFLSEKLKSHKKTIENITPLIFIMRWSAIIAGIVSLLFGFFKP